MRWRRERRGELDIDHAVVVEHERYHDSPRDHHTRIARTGNGRSGHGRTGHGRTGRRCRTGWGNS